MVFELYVVRCETSPLDVACSLAAWRSGLLGGRNTAFPLKLFAGELANAPYAFGLFASPFLGRLFVMLPESHIPENALTLHLFLQNTERLLNVVITYQNLQFMLLGSPTPS
jgi:hypothetical protein